MRVTLASSAPPAPSSPSPPTTRAMISPRGVSSLGASIGGAAAMS
ncbi:hypothetical protein [Ornithinimicrobium sp. F0845]|nr:hypothetical protein [Ornithinimicrobium sp. F0845]